MAAITRDRNTTTRGFNLRAALLAANAVLYSGTLVCFDGDGYVVNGANTAGYKFAGLAREAGDNTGGADGDVSTDLYVAKEVKLKSSGLAITDIGCELFLLDNQTVVKASYAGLSNWIYVGRMVEYVSATEVWVAIEPQADRPAKRQYTIAITGTNAAAYNLATAAAAFGGSDFFVQAITAAVSYTTATGADATLLVATTDYTLASGTITGVGNKSAKTVIFTFIGQLT